jgi:sodium/bile acid cotransporter 7
MSGELKKVKTVVEARELEMDDVAKKSTESESKTPSVNDRPSVQQPKAPPKKKPFVLRVIRFMQDQWFLIALVILIAIASQHQVPKEHQKLKSTVVSYVCVSVIFFITGCTLKTQVLIENYARWKIHLFVQLQCFFVFSLIMYGIVSAAASNRHFMDPGLLGEWILRFCEKTRTDLK